MEFEEFLEGAQVQHLATIIAHVSAQAEQLHFVMLCKVPTSRLRIGVSFMQRQPRQVSLAHLRLACMCKTFLHVNSNPLHLDSHRHHNRRANEYINIIIWPGISCALREDHTGQGHAQWTLKLSNLECILMDVCRRDGLPNTRCVKLLGRLAHCMDADYLSMMRQHSLTLDGDPQFTLTASSMHLHYNRYMPEASPLIIRMEPREPFRKILCN